MPTYLTHADDITANQLEGFFEGWPDPPSPDTHLLILRNSWAIAVALEDERVVGFANAVSDGVLSAYIPLLEVRPTYRGRGIGTALIGQLLEQLRALYMVDVVCDADVVPFYAKLGLKPAHAMCVRNYDRQSGNARP